MSRHHVSVTDSGYLEFVDIKRGISANVKYNTYM